MPELIPISLVAHQAFCPRRAWLEAAGETTDTHQMAIGTQAHAPADDSTGSRSQRYQAVDVVSHDLGVIGRCDTVELDENAAMTVVEHKATPVRRRPEVTEPMRIQVALLAGALADMGYPVAGQAIYFTNHHTRVDVPLTPADTALARDIVAATAHTLAAEQAPPPLEDDRRCSRCSHITVCLPDERPLAPVTRRIVVADPDTQVLHLTTPGSRAYIARGRIEVSKSGEKVGTFPIERVQGVVVHGNVDLSSGLIREVLWRSLSVVWCTSTGRVTGWARAAQGPNGGPRLLQHVASHHGRIDLARQFVAAKVANQATLLRRHGNAPTAVARLRELQREALEAPSLTDLFGVEGDAAARYFEHFLTMLRPRVVASEGLTFSVRTRRPARDPINAALNFSYGLLTADTLRAVVACGLDPHAGFLHSSGRNKPALALDLVEEFRAAAVGNPHGQPFPEAGTRPGRRVPSRGGRFGGRERLQQWRDPRAGLLDRARDHTPRRARSQGSHHRLRAPRHRHFPSPDIRVRRDVATRYGDPGTTRTGSDRRNTAPIPRNQDPMSLDDVRRYLIAYDVSDDVRRTKVAKKLESYGDRVQYSVFIVDARPAKLLRLRAQLTDLIDQSMDSVLFCNLGTLRENHRRSLDVIGCSRTITDHGPAIL